MSQSQKFNPKLTPVPRKRQRIRIDLVEGEDFKIACPDWCEPLAEAALPDQPGWYLAVALIQADRNKKKFEAEFVYLCEFRLAPDGWAVHEICTDRAGERRSFWWVGKVKMPLLKCLGNGWWENDDDES